MAITDHELIREALDLSVPRDTVAEKAMKVITGLREGDLLQDLLIATVALALVNESRFRSSNVDTNLLWE